MTFLVGAFVILASEAVSFFVFDRHLIRLSAGPGRVPTVGAAGAVTTGAFVGLSFAIGLLVEDACYKFHDPFLYRPFIVTYAAIHPFSTRPAESEMKADIERSVLFREIRATVPVTTSLGKDVCRAKLFELAAPDGGRSVHDWACLRGPLPQSAMGKSGFDAVDAVVRATFFFSKNRVYREENYFNELRRIQSRLEFSRTVATLAFGGVIIALLTIMARLPRLTKEARRSFARRAALLCGVFAVIYVVGSFAYIQESEEYNKRVFGYYAAMVWSHTANLP